VQDAAIGGSGHASLTVFRRTNIGAYRRLQSGLAPEGLRWTTAGLPAASLLGDASAVLSTGLGGSGCTVRGESGGERAAKVSP
jgi:hypothetical protein